jgi:hypothetical protein
LNEDLGAACLGALRVSRQACRAFALSHSWENSARQFIGHVRKVATNGQALDAAEGAPAAAHG